MEFWVAQAIALVICALSAVGYFKKNKESFLLVQIICNVLYCIQYALLGVLSGIVCNLLTIVKFISFRADAKSGRTTSLGKSLVFCVLSVVLGLVAIDSWFSFIPIVIAVMLTFATAQDNPVILRLAYALSNILWIVFNFMGRAYVSALYCAVELIVSLASVMLIYRKNRAQKADTGAAESEK